MLPNALQVILMVTRDNITSVNGNVYLITMVLFTLQLSNNGAKQPHTKQPKITSKTSFIILKVKYIIFVLNKNNLFI